MDLGKGGCGWHDEAAERERTGRNSWAALRPMTEAETALWTNENALRAEIKLWRIEGFLSASAQHGY
jgi:hypothetical protein